MFESTEQDWSVVLDTQREVLAVLDEVLSLRGRAMGFGPDTALLGALPELDSMAVVSIITTLEERFDFIVEDDELDGSTFETVDSLIGFRNHKMK
jgi:acyl carrier protein